MYTKEDKYRDYQWFVDNYDELARNYGHKFLAVRDCQVMGVYATPREALAGMEPEYKAGEFCLQECDPNRKAYKVTLTRSFGV